MVADTIMGRTMPRRLTGMGANRARPEQTVERPPLHPNPDRLGERERVIMKDSQTERERE